MALSLLERWCRGLRVDVRRALLVTEIPEGLGRADIEAVLRPAFLPLGAFRLRNTRAVSKEKATAALVEFLEDINHAAIPREIPGRDGVWRVLCKDRAEDTRVLRQMKRLLLDERPPASGTQARASGQAAGKAGSPPGAASKARRGRRGRGSRARGNRLTKMGKKRARGGRPSTSVRSESEDSSDESLGIIIEEIDEEDLSEENQTALYTTLQVAARELIKKQWARQGKEAEDGDRPREFLALVTVTDKAKKEEIEKEPPGAESINLNITEDRCGIPDLVALLAVRDTSEEEPMDSDASESESQENGDKEEEGVDNPEFVAIVAYTDPSDPSAREEMMKIASVIQSLGWSDKKDREDVLPEVLSVMAKDTSGTRVKVEEAGREVDAMVLRKARDDGNLLECISTLAEPETLPKGKAHCGFLGGWGDDDDDDDDEYEGGLLELVALLAAQDMGEVMKEEKENAWEGGKYKYARGNLGKVLALLAARENMESDEGSEEEEEAESQESEDSESEESEPEDRASKKPRAKRARTASRGLGSAPPAAAPTPSGRKTRRGGRGRGRGRGVTPERSAGSRAAAQDEPAGNKKKKAGARAHAKAGEAKSARGKKARRGRRLPPKCR